MKRIENKIKNICITVMAILIFTPGCTKYQNGFISSTMQYAISTFTIKKGSTASSNSLVSDGSSIPLKVKWTHIYDESGKIVDTLFSKTYPVDVWTAVYDSKTDTSYATVMKKRATQDLPPIVVNETSGVIQANAATYYLPVGKYMMDLEVTNIAGTQELKKAMTLDIIDGETFETTPEPGSYSLSMLIANTASGAPFGALYNGNNNPFVTETITRVADTPNAVTIKITDKNGVVFSPANNEIMKRPNSGLNPKPPYLQNLQDYAPDTFKALDTAMYLNYPLVPFPIESLGNGYNMYYRLPTKFVHIDSTTKGWSGNPAGNLYKGTSDPNFLGYFKDDLYDYSLRIPMRVLVPGAYFLNIKLLNVTHR